MQQLQQQHQHQPRATAAPVTQAATTSAEALAQPHEERLALAALAQPPLLPLCKEALEQPRRDQERPAVVALAPLPPSQLPSAKDILALPHQEQQQQQQCRATVVSALKTATRLPTAIHADSEVLAQPHQERPALAALAQPPLLPSCKEPLAKLHQDHERPAVAAVVPSPPSQLLYPYPKEFTAQPHREQQQQQQQQAQPLQQQQLQYRATAASALKTATQLPTAIHGEALAQPHQERASLVAQPHQERSTIAAQPHQERASLAAQPHHEPSTIATTALSAPSEADLALHPGRSSHAQLRYIATASPDDPGSALSSRAALFFGATPSTPSPQGQGAAAWASPELALSSSFYVSASSGTVASPSSALPDSALASPPQQQQQQQLLLRRRRRAPCASSSVSLRGWDGGGGIGIGIGIGSTPVDGRLVPGALQSPPGGSPVAAPHAARTASVRLPPPPPFPRAPSSDATSLRRSEAAARPSGPPRHDSSDGRQGGGALGPRASRRQHYPEDCMDATGAAGWVAAESEQMWHRVGRAGALRDHPTSCSISVRSGGRAIDIGA